MKTNIRTLTLGFVASLLLVCPVLGASYVFGLSPHYDQDNRKPALQETLLFILEWASPGDQITFVDAVNQTTVTRLSIPAGKLYESNPRARAQRVGPQLGALKGFVMADRPCPPGMTNVILLPQFLEFVSTQLRRPGEPLRVIVIASPFYRNNQEPAYDMQDAYPTDAHLAATPRDSVFSCSTRQRNLAGVTVHYALVNPQFVNDFHQERTRRFWTLFCQQQQGGLSTFTADLPLAIQRAKDGITQPCAPVQLDPAESKIEMRHVAPRSIPTWFGPTNVMQHAIQSLSVPQASPAPALQPPVAFPIRPTANQVGIGIAWESSVDMDLYVSPKPSAEELWFHHTQTPEGRYFHDYRMANSKLDYEYIELKPPVDLTQATAYVNYYEGRTSPVRGIVVLFYEGKSFYGRFEIDAPQGNKGAGRGNRDSNAHWFHIDLGSLVNGGNQARPAGAPR